MRFLLMVMALLAPTAAQAKWYAVSSDHFVIYADDKPERIRKFTENLEHFHAAMAYVTGADLPVPSPSNRVTIYVAGSEAKVRDLKADGDKFTAGFYRPAAGASSAFVPDIPVRSDKESWAMTVLFHEYAHHFFIGAQGAVMPRWVSEGAAEFYSAASFERDGSVGLGKPAIHRAAELFLSREVPLTALLDEDAYREWRKKGQYDSYYGKSWLLFHYLMFNKERKSQFRTYLLLLGEGKPSLAAAQEAFGDLKTLESDLDTYLVRSRMTYLKLSPETLPVFNEPSVRELRAGEVAMMPVIMRLKAGVPKGAVESVVEEARKLAASYPDDPAVLAGLAEAEYDAGHDDAAINAADRAIAADPSIPDAYVQKGYALFRKAYESGDADAFAQARTPFIALNKLEHDHPVPLIYFYRSFAAVGGTLPEIAFEALRRALELAPFDSGVRLDLAHLYIDRDDLPHARTTLMPLVADPHDRTLATISQRMVESIDKGERPQWPTEIDQAPEGEEEGE